MSLLQDLEESVKQAPSNRGRRFIPAWLDAERRHYMADGYKYNVPPMAPTSRQYHANGIVKLDKDPTVLVTSMPFARANKVPS